MHRFLSSIIRTSAFLRKEIVEVLRQPRLLLSLVLGPFLILLIFGVGYRNQPRELRTLFVVQNDGTLGQNIQDYATTLGPQLVFAGTTEDLASALKQLQRGEVDLVAVTPEKPFEKIRSNEQAVFTLYHREIDPFQVEYVKYFGQIYIDEVNRRVLTNVTEQGQSEASTVEDDIKAARQNAAAMRQALEQGNNLAAQESQMQLSDNLDNASLALGASLSLLTGVQQEVGSEDSDYIELLKSNLSDIRQTTSQLDEFSELSSASSADIQEISKIEEDLAGLESQIDQFTSISPFVLVTPFASETKGIAPTQPGPVEFYAPAVIALLLQHLAVTFGALSIVRENDIGAMELFRVSPISAAETLIGKYLSYFIFTALLTAILTALLILALRLPMLGNWVHYVLIIAIILFTSLGIGFLISLLSHTDSQAVQLTMIVLLASVFFSGFLLDLQLIWDPVKVLSWSLPTTYGIVMIRDIFLLGQPPDVFMIMGLFGIGLVLMLISWLLLRREIASE
jgi:ABC-2 type transport system permease protein